MSEVVILWQDKSIQRPMRLSYDSNSLKFNTVMIELTRKVIRSNSTDTCSFRFDLPFRSGFASS